MKSVIQFSSNSPAQEIALTQVLQDLKCSICAYTEFLADFIPTHKQVRTAIRLAPHDDIIADVLHSKDHASVCGLTSLPGHFSRQKFGGSKGSNHRNLQALKHENAVLSDMEKFREALLEIPILSHEGLQLEYEFCRAQTGIKPRSRLAIDGISIQAGALEAHDETNQLAAYIRSLCVISDEYVVSHDEAWPVYKTQGFVVRAPNAGMAWLKLQALIQRLPITKEGLRRITEQALPEIVRLEAHSNLCEDLRPRAFKVMSNQLIGAT